MWYIQKTKGQKTKPFITCISQLANYLSGLSSESMLSIFAKANGIKHLEDIIRRMSEVGRRIIFSKGTIRMMSEARLEQVLLTNDLKTEKIMQAALSLNQIKFQKHIAPRVQAGRGFVNGKGSQLTSAVGMT